MDVGQPTQVAEETSHWQSEGSNRGTAVDTRTCIRDYGSISRDGGGSGDTHSSLKPLIQSFMAVLSDSDYGVENTDPETGVLYDMSLYIVTPASFRRMICLYSLVPITSIFTVLFFILLRYFLWPANSTSPFASYIGLAMLGAAAWTVSFALRVPIFLLSSLLCHTIGTFTPFVSASLQVFTEETLRLFSLIFIHLRLSDNSTLAPGDPAFSRVWTIALGWAAADVTVSVYQGYGQLLLYKDLDDSPWSDRRRFPDTNTTESRCFHDPEEALNREIDEVIRVRARTELEALYGVPVPDIPVFVSCLLRIDSITLSLAFFLIISTSYLPSLPRSPQNEHSLPQMLHDILPTFLALFVLRSILSSCWTLNVLPRIGLHAASYMSCIFALGAFFVGLGRWDAV